MKSIRPVNLKYNNHESYINWTLSTCITIKPSHLDWNYIFASLGFMGLLCLRLGLSYLIFSYNFAKVSWNVNGMDQVDITHGKVWTSKEMFSFKLLGIVTLSVPGEGGFNLQCTLSALALFLNDLWPPRSKLTLLVIMKTLLKNLYNYLSDLEWKLNKFQCSAPIKDFLGCSKLNNFTYIRIYFYS